MATAASRSPVQRRRTRAPGPLRRATHHLRLRAPLSAAVRRRAVCARTVRGDLRPCDRWLTVAMLRRRLGGRLMARRQPLELVIGVRVPAPQLSRARGKAGACVLPPVSPVAPSAAAPPASRARPSSTTGTVTVRGSLPFAFRPRQTIFTRRAPSLSFGRTARRAGRARRRRPSTWIRGRVRPRRRPFGSETRAAVMSGPRRGAWRMAASTNRLPRFVSVTLASGSQPGVARSCLNSATLPEWAVSLTAISVGVPSRQRSFVNCRMPFGPPSNWSVKLRSGRSGFVGKMFRVPNGPTSVTPSIRRSTGGGRMTIRPGRGAGVF